MKNSKNFVCKEKLSKKAQREMHLSQRRTWGPLNPVTRTTKNDKAYDRKKLPKGDELQSLL